MKSDINCNSEYKTDKNIIYKSNKEIKRKEKNIENPKNKIIIKTSSTAKIKIYDDNIKKLESLFNFSQKRKILMGIGDDIKKSSISRNDMKKKNNIKLLGKNYNNIFNETEKDIINSSKIDTIRIILEEMM